MATVSQTLAVAARHHQAGRLEQAETGYKQVLRVDPQQPLGLHLLGIVSQQLGKNDVAITYLSRTIPLGRPTAEIYCTRAAAFLATGKIDEAIDDLQRALEIDPDFPPALSNLGHALSERGEFQQAETHCRRAAELDPLYAAAHVNLGRALKAQYKLDEAIDCYQRALQIDPGCAVTHNNLGNALRKRHKIAEAVASFRRAVQIRPEYVEAQVGLGAALLEGEDYLEARTWLERVLQVAPGNVAALGSMASFYEGRNRPEKALAYVARGFTEAPDDRLLNLVAARCERRSGRIREAINRLQRLLASDASAEDECEGIFFELGRLYDRDGQMSRAFSACTKGNRLVSRWADGPEGDKGQILKEIDLWAEAFHESWVDSWSPAAPLDRHETPAFMIGFPRSGTTLLDQILDSHPQIQTLSEKPTLMAVKHAIEQISPQHARVVTHLSPPQFEKLRAAYFGVVDKYLQRRPELMLIDKMPVSTTDVGLILRLFPAARFIMPIRHPCDVCLSCFMQNFTMNTAMANFLTLEDTASFYVKVMGLWQQYVRVLPHPYHIVRYEDLVDDFEGETRRVLEFLELDWDDAVRGHVEHAQQREGIRTASHDQVVEPIYRRSVYRWKRYARQLAPIMDMLGPFIDYFGYAE